VLHEKMPCHHGEAGHFFECTMTPGHPGIHYGLIAPVAPTTTSLITSISAPEINRAMASQYGEAANSGFLPTPLQPPRL
jgi:hypothetical protein